MARRVYETTHADEEEVADILRLLSDNDLDHYQTPTGLFGLSPGAIWVVRDVDFAAARALIEDYDRARTRELRRRYESEGDRPRGLLGVLRHLGLVAVNRPLEMLLVIVVIALVILLNLLFYRALAG